MLEEKTCSKCRKIKPVGEFYKFTRGISSYCKICMRQLSHQYRHSKEGKEKIKQYRQSEKGRENILYHRKHYSDSGETQAYHKKWINTPRGKESLRKSGEKQRKLHPERKIYVLYRAVKNGTIVRPDSCSICKKKCKPEGHHEDYYKLLDVIWVCSICHKAIHKAKREALI